MATRGTAPLQATRWAGRMVEWGILSLVILVLMGSLGHYARVVQGQAERAAVQSTLGALRTALVHDFLLQQVRAGSADVASLQRNPFRLLDQVPPNYAGEVPAAQLADLPAGQWLFEPTCVCIAYLPMHPEWLDSSNETHTLWFHIEGAPGPLQITPLQVYRWLGDLIN